ncbi:MAG: PhzF family phenazine biosynthesis protein [Alphaproteobacteria bacterium]|nr:MAG: PhzF family phenazine biosynthesis protein [Caulobacteraceae bacterium]TPW05864.1 MAG: PhzF family phenazine biosynthesis protein [Alphaproteobacteria bacterium]
MSRRYTVLDVFTQTPLAGNPLAVVSDAEGLDNARMQAIAKEFNLSETVFILPPDDPHRRAKLRIFTPGSELPFAGHPTVGTAVLLSLMHGDEGAAAFGLEEQVGVVSCVTERRGERSGYARFRVPKLPAIVGRGLSAAAAADALGLGVADIGFGHHTPSKRAVGGQFDLVPLASLDALKRAWPTASFASHVTGDHPAVFLYAPSPGGLRARMYGPGLGIVEDPATGSAVACLAGALADHEGLADGTHDFVIDQGVEMGRASRIELQIVMEGGTLVAAEIGGAAVVVAEGVLHD